MWGKKFVDSIEDEFTTSKLRSKHLFHDINLRINDPDEFKQTTINYLRSLDFNINVSELTEFDEDKELSKFFKAGRLKPIRSIIKAGRQTITGSKYPVIWKLLVLTAIISIIGLMLPYQQLNKELLFYITTLSLITSLIAYGAKQVIKSSVWIKVVGIYDVENTKADVRVIISADINKYNQKVFNKLQEDVTELYELISHKYLKPTQPLVKPVTKTRSDELINRIAKINEQERKAREQLLNNKISEETYKQLISDLRKEKNQVNTIIDLLSI